MNKRVVVAVLLGNGIAICGACTTVSPHENFVDIMQGNVNRNSDDYAVYRNRNREWLVSTRKLTNGNVEEEYKAGRRLLCRVFFEIDEGAKNIVGWRYEGAKNDCVIVP